MILLELFHVGRNRFGKSISPKKEKIAAAAGKLTERCENRSPENRGGGSCYESMPRRARATVRPRHG
jgi:hypothetical protein